MFNASLELTIQIYMRFKEYLPKYNNSTYGSFKGNWFLFSDLKTHDELVELANKHNLRLKVPINIVIGKDDLINLGVINEQTR